MSMKFRQSFLITHIYFTDVMRTKEKQPNV